ncbi:M1 family aminopeptidase [Fulvivirgaceae bacterium BMA10]|uniref:M1 family aminopeptidase n=1 Tax=Splendidivirga corallicola TaxID=3051826 RepID=A0ABT8KJX9_9BACT|nr:M1 family aminopeptidase [Fulvivirgaceae bacterium BMA10]
MFQKLLRFEWQYHSRQISFILFFIVFMLYGALAISENFDFLGNTLHINDPYVLSLITGVVSLGSVFPIMFFSVNAMLRDRAHNSEGIVFSTAIKKNTFFLSRFSGIFFTALIVSSISLAGMYLGTFMVDIDPLKINGFHPDHYFWPWLLFILPNTFMFSAFLMAIAVLTRSAVASYAGGIFIFALYWMCGFYINSPLTGGSVLASQGILDIASMIDPFGLSAFFDQTQFWTPLQKSQDMISLSGNFLWNRILWMSIAGSALIVSYRLFSFRKANEKLKKNNTTIETPKVKTTTYTQVASFPTTIKAQFKTFISLVKIEFWKIFKSLPFLAIILVWSVMVFLGFNFIVNGPEEYGSRYPTTELLVGLIAESLTTFGLLLVIFYSGELMWRTRQFKFNEIVDATPASNFTLFLSKYVVLAILPLLLLSIGIILAVSFQVYKAYYHIDLGFYFSMFYYFGLQFLLYGFFALFIQALVPYKYLGMVLSGLIIIVLGPSSHNIGLEHPLLRLNVLPNMVRSYSDLTGYGQFVKPFHWFALYWSAFTGMIVLLSVKLWKRGTDHSFRKRLKLLFQPWTKFEKIMLSGAFVAFVSAGIYILYNINIVNEYKTEEEAHDFNENYERQFKKYEALAVPQVIEVKTKVEISPQQQKYSVQADCILENKNDVPLEEIFVSTPKPMESLHIEKSELVMHDSWLGGYLFKLYTPLQPGQQLKLTYDLEEEIKGFASSKAILGNGSYIRHSSFQPYLGYVDLLEINDPYEREKRGLPKKEKITIADNHLQNAGKFNTEKVRFETVLCTSGDQIGIGSGKLIRQWEEGGKNYYHYKTIPKVYGNMAYFSGRFEVRKVDHKGISIEMYYHPTHYHNIEEMIQVTKATLDYCSAHFGPYPHDYLRIAEVHSGGGFGGQALPGVISMAEMAMYTKDTRNPDAINIVARRTIHEVAHQWWGHLVSPKRIEGSKVLSESLAKYTESVIMEKLYGRAMVRKLTNYTARRYFSGRSYADVPEPPLYLTDQQQYLAYSKGYIVMLAIKDLIGEEAVNIALGNLAKKHSSEPTATTLDLLNELYQVTPIEHHNLIDDWMKRVITYDLKLTSCSYRKLSDGKYEVRATVNAKRFETQENGQEIQIPIDEPIQIGIFKKHPNEMKKNEDAIYLEKRQIDQEETIIKIIVDEVPGYIGIDPYLTRLDKVRRDNLKEAKEGSLVEEKGNGRNKIALSFKL